LSGIEVSLLIDSAYGSSYRVLIVYYPQFIATLLMTRKNSSVLIPPSLQVAKQYHNRPYTQDCPLLYEFVHFNWNTTQLRPPLRENTFSKANINSINWKQHEQQWRDTIYIEASFYGSFYMLIVTPDMAMIRNYYSTIEGTHILDPLHDEIEKAVDIFLSPAFIAQEKDGQKRHCVIVLNAQLLSEARHQFIVSRCAAMKVRVAMVTDKYNPTDKTIRVVASNTTRLVEVDSSHFKLLCS
jgi:hypothetical protein